MEDGNGLFEREQIWGGWKLSIPFWKYNISDIIK
jgi:hypothetical protein